MYRTKDRPHDKFAQIFDLLKIANARVGVWRGVPSGPGGSDLLATPLSGHGSSQSAKWLMALDVALAMAYIRLMNTNTAPMPEVYAVLTMGMDYYDSLELAKIFGTKESAEAYAAELREMTEEVPCFDEDEMVLKAEPMFAQVKVEAHTLN